MSEYTIKTVSGSVVRFDDTGDGLPLTNCEVNIVPKIEMETVSGSVVAFSDGADDVPLKKFEMNIDSNLTGASEIVVTKTGKNALPNFVAGTYTDNGITATVGEDNICRITGKNTSGENALVVVPLEKEVIVSNQLYCHIRNNNATTLSGLSMRLKSHWPSLNVVNRIFAVTNSQEGLANIAIQVAGSQTSELDFTINPSFEYSNVETGYEPYKEAEVIEVGIPNNNNLFDKTKTDTDNGFIENKYLSQSGGGNTSQNYNVSEYIAIEGGKNYILNNCTGNAPSIVFYDLSKYIISGIAYNNKKMIAVQSPQNAAYCRISIPKANINILHLKQYIPIYGGMVDVLNGTGTKTWDKVVYTGADSETWQSADTSGIHRFRIDNNNIKQPTEARGIVYSSIGQYSASGNDVGTVFSYWTGTNVKIYYVPPQTCETVEEFKAWLQNNNLYVVYEKAAPEDFTFTPVPVSSRLGYNTMWSDLDLDVTYYKKGYNTKTVDVVQTEKNIVNFTSALLNSSGGFSFSANSDGSISYSGTASSTWAYITDLIPVSFKKGTVLTFSRGSSFEYRHNIRFTLFDDTVINMIIDAGNTSKTFTLTDDVKYCRLYMSQISTQTQYSGTIFPLLEAGDTASSYEKYHGEIKTANLGHSINGGTVNVLKGTGISKYAMAAFSDCSWSCITSYQSNFNATNGIISVRFGKTAMGNAGYALTTEGVVCNNFANNNRSVWNNVDRLNEIGYTDGIVINMHYSDIGLEAWTDNSSTTLAAWKSSELYLSGIFALIKAAPEPFTFTPIQLTSHSSNTLWSTEGDVTVSYYSYIETDGRYLIYGDTLTDIADAIREKTSIVGPINVNDFVTDIMTIDDAAPDAEEVEF